MEYFIIENAQQAGPFSLDQLAQKRITQETLVWCEGMAAWTPAWQVEALKPLFYAHAGTQGPSAGVPPVPPVSHPQQPDSHKKENHHLLPKMVLGVFIAALAVLAFTNPDREAHRTAVKKQLHTIVDKSGEDILGDNILAMGLRSIAQMISGSMMDVAFDQFFEYHNYVLFSKGTVSFEGQEHNVSFGILGKVYTFNADDVIRAIEGGDESAPQNTGDGNTVQENDADQDYGSDTNPVEKRMEEKASQVMNKVGERISHKVEEKINSKLDQLTDSSTLDKIIGKIFGETGK